MTTYPTPICMFCQRRAAEGMTCEAYPAGIPEAILQSRLDHRKPIPGDNDLQFVAVDGDGSFYAGLLFKTVEAENA